MHTFGTTSHSSRAAASGANSTEDLGKLLLRAGLAILILFHGVSKLFGGISGISGMLGAAGLPAVFGYGVYIGEVIAPILMLLGIWTRPAALIVAFNMIVAVFLAHMPQLMQLAKSGGWALELQGMFFIAALAVALLGAGRYSIGGSAGRWN